MGEEVLRLIKATRHFSQSSCGLCIPGPAAGPVLSFPFSPILFLAYLLAFID